MASKQPLKRYRNLYGTLTPPINKTKKPKASDGSNTENSSDVISQILCDSLSSQGDNIDNQVNGFKSSSKGKGISKLTRKDSDNSSCNDVIVISSECDTNDTDSNSDPLPTVSTLSLQSSYPPNRSVESNTVHTTNNSDPSPSVSTGSLQSSIPPNRSSESNTTHTTINSDPSSSVSILSLQSSNPPNRSSESNTVHTTNYSDPSPSASTGSLQSSNPPNQSSESNTAHTTINSDPSSSVSTGSLQSSNPPNRKQLLFLYDHETTAWSHYVEHIIEIASAVIVPDNSNITQTEFSSLCHTSRRISIDAYMKHGITEEMLVGQPSFAVVFRRFLEWIDRCIKEACGSNEFHYYPVLVAHNGFSSHYYFLMSEINRHNLECTNDDLCFADTLNDIRRFSRARNPIFPNYRQQGLGLVSLFRAFFPNQNFQDPRRAMEDVQALKQIFTTPVLAPVLTHLTIKKKVKIWEKWLKKWVSKPYIAIMGRDCSESLAFSLHSKGITYNHLEAIFVGSSLEEYDNWLKRIGVKRKNWRNKIQNHFLFKYSVITICVCTYLLCVCLYLYESIEPYSTYIP